MKRNIFVPFAVWGTRLKRRRSPDPFARSRFILASLFFIVGLIISIVISDIMDAIVRQYVYLIALDENGTPVEDAFRYVQHILWIGRLVKLGLLVIAAYFLAWYAMRPLRRMSDLQRRFIANVSHELRTPLAIGKSSTEVALRKSDSLSREEAIGLLKKNLEETNRMAHIIDAMLELSGGDFEQQAESFSRTSMSERVQSSVERMREVAETKNVSIEYVPVSEPLIVRGNVTALEEVLDNLLKNAITHTPSSASIRVQASRKDGTAEVTVHNPGKGITKNELPHIFEPFYRGTEEKGKGAGLGLSIAQEIVWMHAGRIRVSNPPEGGVTFTIHIPLA